MWTQESSPVSTIKYVQITEKNISSKAALSDSAALAWVTLRGSPLNLILLCIPTTICGPTITQMAWDWNLERSIRAWTSQLVPEIWSLVKHLYSELICPKLRREWRRWVYNVLIFTSFSLRLLVFLWYCSHTWTLNSSMFWFRIMVLHKLHLCLLVTKVKLTVV